MNVQFQDSDPQACLTKIKDTMGSRELSKMVSFDINSGEMLVTISKLGTSTLHFQFSQNAGGCLFKLTKEKIALTHRPLKAEVTAKIIKVLEKAGGLVSY